MILAGTCIASVSNLYADGEYFPELIVLYESDLVIDAQYIKSNDDFVWVRVNEVLKDGVYGIKPGDHVRFVKVHSDGCGFPFNYSAYKRSRIYLSKDTDQWRLMRDQASAVKWVSDQADMAIGNSSVKLPVKEFNRKLREFIKCYEMKEGMNRFQLLVSEEEIELKAKSNPFIDVFEKSGRLPEPEVFLPEELTENSDHPVEILPCSFSATQPSFNNGEGDEALAKYLRSAENPGQEWGISGKVYLKFLIRDDGSVDDIEVVRDIGARCGEVAVQLMENMPMWDPAKNHRGQSISCYQTLPFFFELKDR